MLALVLTCRPQWQPWLLHQLAKQETPHSLVVFDDCSKPQRWSNALFVMRPDNRLSMTLGEKRQSILGFARDLNECFAWFDDDDWHPKERLAVGSEFFFTGSSYDVDAVGYHEGIFCDVKSLQTRKLDTHETLTFNSAVFAPQCASVPFDHVNRGEDTMWIRKVLKDATVVSSPIMEHCWMSHDGNVTGKRGSMTFEGPRFQRFDSWELEFLKKL